jgi:hypothetical protein
VRGIATLRRAIYTGKTSDCAGATDQPLPIPEMKIKNKP